MKLYAIIKNEEGKELKIGSNEMIECTLYEKNKKQYSVYIYWENVGDFEKPVMSSVITTREWRNEPNNKRIMPKSQKQKGEICTHCGKRHKNALCDGGMQ